ncbi:L,D-transpeptidase [Streptomyces silvisoli]|uniref:Ig-like domain-containing protein n=1 Tax=Streptomyces silvisoli TaxID=3034235 RepID=A0ABT5ZFD9_9ACTN|nr:Ig-like domain-containing protein [Streptomyces silvisoli]MDF3288540.1 Ig-like domain-containing protein [Streptomyces silvisoli]
MSQISRGHWVICRLSYLALLAPLAAELTACGGSGNPLAAAPYDAAGQVSYSTGDGSRQVDPNRPLDISIKGDGNRITDVTATDAAGHFVRGELGADRTRWHSTSPFAAGAHYTVRVSTENANGAQGRQSIAFDTRPARDTLGVKLGPDSGDYGVGQPITAELSQPVKDPAARVVVESALHVSSVPAVTGAWHWVDDRTLHYRPREFWPTDARINVTSTLLGARIQGQLYGGEAKPVTLHTGDQVIAVTDAAAHHLTLSRNGKVQRVIPVTTGKPGFSTRNGIKVVLDKESFVRMKSSTIGIAEGSSDSYDLPVHWATRVTWSGEFVHAAPWSVGSQGSDNVSHGCTGMSTENAHWFFDQVRNGDIVQVVNSQGATMEPFGNGFGDWNLTWDQWTKGSAMGARGVNRPGGQNPSAPRPTSPARLTPRM